MLVLYVIDIIARGVGAEIFDAFQRPARPVLGIGRPDDRHPARRDEAWQQLDQRKQATSAGWRVPELDDVRPIIEVTLDDGTGDLRSDRVELSHGILVRRPAPPVRDPDEHD